MIYGYVRVSTDHQTVKNQKHEISIFCRKNQLKVDCWVDEVISSTQPIGRRKLGGLLRRLCKGDVLIASEISRLGRNLLEVMTILQQCLEKGCQIWTLKENYRLGADIQSKVLAFAFSLAGEIERQMISERTKNSLRRLKDEGKKLGRPYGCSYQKLQKEHCLIKKMLASQVPKAEIARMMGVGWTTLHRYISKCC
ncbi:MAG: recombinase family protein [Alphaproteobacteria bacterium]|nr:recombinase family protein [Alphaproteobacteria bacterium]